MSSLGARQQARDQGECWAPTRRIVRRTSFWKRCSPVRKRQLKEAWLSDETRQSIAERFATTVPTLCRIALAEGWPPRTRGPRCRVMADRVLLELEAAEREGRMLKVAAGRLGLSTARLRAMARILGRPPVSVGLRLRTWLLGKLSKLKRAWQSPVRRRTVAETFGVSESTLRRLAREYGWTACG